MPSNAIVNDLIGSHAPLCEHRNAPVASPPKRQLAFAHRWQPGPDPDGATRRVVASDESLQA
jgi:hypothetical protein